MENSKAYLCLTLAFAFTFPHSANAAEAITRYEFNPSVDCKLSRYVKREWQKARMVEIGHPEPFLLHEVHHQPGVSSFYANHELFSAPTQCFTAVNESKKTEPAAEEPKIETTHAGVESHDLLREHEKEHGEEKEEEMESEFLHQAARHVFEATPSLGYVSASATYQDANIDSSKATGLVAGTVLEYGVTKNISVGSILTYDSLSRSTAPDTSKTSAKGLEDPKFFANGKLEFGHSAVRLNLLLDTAFSHHVTQSNGDENLASGGLVFTPALGYELYLGHNIVGAQVAYDVVKSEAKKDTLDSAGALTTVTATGGKALTGALFFEHRFRKGEYGISLQYIKANHTTEDGVDKNNGGAMWIGTLYGEIELSEKVSLLPAIIYSKPNFLESQENENVKSVSTFGMILGARFKIE
jgi:hypothetical protein